LKVRSAATPIVLVVLAAATAAYALLVDRATVSDLDREIRKRDVFPSFRIDEVRRVELVHGAEILVLERTADSGATSWEMTSPRRERADPAPVDTLLRELEMATRVRDVPPAEAAGMDAPRVRGRVTVGALEYRFVLGAAAPRPEGAAYMRVEGEGTFVVGRSLSVQLLRGADAYRERTLAPYGEGGVARLEIRSAAGELTLERAGTTFRLHDGGGLRASRLVVDRLFAALAEVRAETFLDDGQADVATAAPALTVVIVPRDASQPRVRLLVGGSCPGHEDGAAVVRTEPQRVSGCAARGPIATLEQSQDALIDASPLFARADEIEELRIEPIEGSGPRVDVARHGAGWHERAPEDRDLTADEVDSAGALVAALSNARAIDVRPGGGLPSSARWRLTAVRAGAGAIEQVEIGAPEADGSALARRIDDGAILRLPAHVARRFEAHPVALRSPALWQAPFDAAAVVAIDDSCGPAPRRFAMRDGVWRARGGKAADSGPVGDLLGAFARARAESWVTESDDGSFGLSGASACSVVLTLSAEDGGSRRAGLIFGAKGEGGVYARTLDASAVLVAPAALRESAGRLGVSE